MNVQILVTAGAFAAAQHAAFMRGTTLAALMGVTDIVSPVALPPVALPTGAKPAPAPDPEPVETREATPEESAALIARLTH